MSYMDSKSQFTVDIISKVIDGRISINSEATLLSKSRRTVERYLSRYRKEGIRFVIHGNKGQIPVNKISESLKKEVQELIQTKYYDFNLQHLAELLVKNEGIDVKRETLRTSTKRYLSCKALQATQKSRKKVPKADGISGANASDGRQPSSVVWW